MSNITSTIRPASTIGVSTFTEGGGTLSALTDIDLQNVVDGSLLIYDTNEFVARTLSGDATIDKEGLLTISPNSVTLGVDTSGNYVSTITGTTDQVIVSGSGVESAAITLSLPQSLAPSSSPTFNSITLNGTITNTDLSSKLDLKAPLESPNFSGTPTAPTPTVVTDSSTKIATTAFVNNVLADNKLTANTTVTIPLINPDTGSAISAAKIQSIIDSYPKDLNGYGLTFQFEEGHYTLDTTSLQYGTIAIWGFYGGGLQINGKVLTGESYDNSVNHRTFISFIGQGFNFGTTAQYDVNNILFENKSNSGPIIRVDNNNLIKINNCAFYQALTNVNGTPTTQSTGHRLIDCFMSNGVWLYGCTFGNSFGAMYVSRNAQLHAHSCTSMNKITNLTKKTPRFAAIGDASALELVSILADPAKNRPQYFIISDQGGIALCNGENFDGVIAQYSKDNSSIISNRTADTFTNQTLSGIKTFSSSPVVPTPVLATDAVTKAYVDEITAHAPARVAITTPLEQLIPEATITYSLIASGQFTITNMDVDWVTLLADSGLIVNSTNGSRVLVTGQSNPARNGIYFCVSSRNLRRVSDFNSMREMSGGDFVFVTHGTYANTCWALRETVTTINTSPVEFIQISGPGAVEAGAGLIRNGTTLSLPTIGTVGTYTSVTTDAYGRVTGGSNPTKLSDYGITDAVTLDTAQNIIGEKTFSASPHVPQQPTAASHAASKAYVDSVAEGLHVHESVHALLKTPLSSKGIVVNYDNGQFGVGATLTATSAANWATAFSDPDITVGSRVIVGGETNGAYNGIYTVESNTQLKRAVDFDTSAEMDGGDFVFVTHGVYADTGWVLSEAVPSVGLNSVNFIQFSGAGAYEAGDGLERDGTTFNAVAGTGITVSSDISLSTSGVDAGTYKSVTVDAYGRVTGGSNPTKLSGYGITDAVTLDTDQNNISGQKTFTTFPLLPEDAPTANRHPTSKSYVDTLYQGISATVKSVATGDPGTQANVTNGGNTQAVEFEFTIPRGDKGETGDRGLQGIQGFPGVDALWNYTGEYGIGVSYAVGDLATYEGSMFYRKDSHDGNTGDTPVIGGPYWDIIAKKGDKGDTGETGSIGPIGPSAYTFAIEDGDLKLYYNDQYAQPVAEIDSNGNLILTIN